MENVFDASAMADHILKKTQVIELYWKKIDEELGFMERMVLPDGREILFDHDAGKTDFEPLRAFIGYDCAYHYDGEFRWMKPLVKIAPAEDGVMALHFEYKPIDRETGGSADVEVDLPLNDEE